MADEKHDHTFKTLTDLMPEGTTHVWESLIDTFNAAMDNKKLPDEPACEVATEAYLHHNPTMSEDEAHEWAHAALEASAAFLATHKRIRLTKAIAEKLIAEMMKKPGADESAVRIIAIDLAKAGTTALGDKAFRDHVADHIKKPKAEKKEQLN